MWRAVRRERNQSVSKALSIVFLFNPGPVFGKGGRHGLGVASDTTVLLAYGTDVVSGAGEHAFKLRGNVVAFFFPVVLSLLLFLR